MGNTCNLTLSGIEYISYQLLYVSAKSMVYVADEQQQLSIGGHGSAVCEQDIQFLVACIALICKKVCVGYAGGRPLPPVPR